MSDENSETRQKITLPEVIDLANQAAASSMGPSVDSWDDLFPHQKEYYLERYEIEGLEDTEINPVSTTGTYILEKAERVVSEKTSKKLDKVLRKSLTREIEIPFRAGDVVRCKIDGVKYIIYETRINEASWTYSTDRVSWIRHDDLTLIRPCDQRSLKKLISCIGDDR